MEKYGREIAQMLLIHCKRGYTFTTLDTVMGRKLTPEIVALRPVVPTWITDGQ